MQTMGFWALLIIGSCGHLMAGAAARSSEPQKYVAHRLRQSHTVDADWDSDVWRHVPALEIRHPMGAPPNHRPRTQAKVLYDDLSLYVIFRVEDQYVRAVARKHHDAVCRDSCVEFFFTPRADVQPGYLNLEMNCCGMLLFGIHTPETPDGLMAAEDCEKIEIARSLPQQTIDPEISTPVVWTIECRLPFEVLRKYIAFDAPAPGGSWRTNFYKCGDATSHPHWLTWSVVNLPQPDFHQPAFFGWLDFGPELTTKLDRK